MLAPRSQLLQARQRPAPAHPAQARHPQSGTLLPCRPGGVVCRASARDEELHHRHQVHHHQDDREQHWLKGLGTAVASLGLAASLALQSLSAPAVQAAHVEGQLLTATAHQPLHTLAEMPMPAPKPLSPRERADAFDLAGYSFRAATTSVEASRLIDQGLLLAYNFNQIEARRSFEAALALDPSAAMAYWGLAYSYGPFYNKVAAPPPADNSYPVFTNEELLAGRRAIESGLKVVERKLRVANQSKRSAEVEQLQKEKAFLTSLAPVFRASTPYGPEWKAANQQYAQSLERWAAAHPKDSADALALAAEAWTNELPWQLWDDTQFPPTPRGRTPHILDLLQRSLAVAPAHPLAAHLLIHATEARDPAGAGEALVAAQQVAKYHDFAHLVHMPSHTYIRTGRWHDAVEATRKALQLDVEHARAGFVTEYPCHDAVMGVYGAMEGAEKAAAEQLASDMARLPQAIGPLYMAEGRERVVLPVVQLRFADWAALEPLTAAQVDPRQDGIMLPPFAPEHSEGLYHYITAMAAAAHVPARAAPAVAPPAAEPAAPAADAPSAGTSSSAPQDAAASPGAPEQALSSPAEPARSSPAVPAKSRPAVPAVAGLPGQAVLVTIAGSLQGDAQAFVLNPTAELAEAEPLLVLEASDEADGSVGAVADQDEEAPLQVVTPTGRAPVSLVVEVVPVADASEVPEGALSVAQAAGSPAPEQAASSPASVQEASSPATNQADSSAAADQEASSPVVEQEASSTTTEQEASSPAGEQEASSRVAAAPALSDPWRSRAEAAQAELARVVDSMPDDAPTRPGDGLGLYSLGYKVVLQQAQKVLGARLAVLDGQWEEATTLLRDAAAEESRYGYAEPPRFYQPQGECLGWVLLQQGRLAEAAEAYTEVLKTHPRTPWALTGLQQVYAAASAQQLAGSDLGAAVPSREEVEDTLAQVYAEARGAAVKLPSSCPMFSEPAPPSAAA